MKKSVISVVSMLAGVVAGTAVAAGVLGRMKKETENCKGSIR